MKGLKSEGSMFRALIRLIDVFVGKVENEVSSDDLKNYIHDTFGVQVSAVSHLIIRTDEYKTSKVSVKLSEKEGNTLILIYGPKE